MRINFFYSTTFSIFFISSVCLINWTLANDDPEMNRYKRADESLVSTSTKVDTFARLMNAIFLRNSISNGNFSRLDLITEVLKIEDPKILEDVLKNQNLEDVDKSIQDLDNLSKSATPIFERLQVFNLDFLKVSSLPELPELLALSDSISSLKDNLRKLELPDFTQLPSSFEKLFNETKKNETLKILIISNLKVISGMKIPDLKKFNVDDYSTLTENLKILEVFSKEVNVSQSLNYLEELKSVVIQVKSLDFNLQIQLFGLMQSIFNSSEDPKNKNLLPAFAGISDISKVLKTDLEDPWLKTTLNNGKGLKVLEDSLRPLFDVLMQLNDVGDLRSIFSTSLISLENNLKIAENFSEISKSSESIIDAIQNISDRIIALDNFQKSENISKIRNLLEKFPQISNFVKKFEEFRNDPKLEYFTNYTDFENALESSFKIVYYADLMKLLNESEVLGNYTELSIELSEVVGSLKTQKEEVEQVLEQYLTVDKNIVDSRNWIKNHNESADLSEKLEELRKDFLNFPGSSKVQNLSFDVFRKIRDFTTIPKSEESSKDLKKITWAENLTRWLHQDYEVLKSLDHLKSLISFIAENGKSLDEILSEVESQKILEVLQKFFSETQSIISKIGSLKQSNLEAFRKLFDLLDRIPNFDLDLRIERLHQNPNPKLRQLAENWKKVEDLKFVKHRRKMEIQKAILETGKFFEEFFGNTNKKSEEEKKKEEEIENHDGFRWSAFNLILTLLPTLTFTILVPLASWDIYRKYRKFRRSQSPEVLQESQDSFGESSTPSRKAEPSTTPTPSGASKTPMTPSENGKEQEKSNLVSEEEETRWEPFQ